jgi:hypothetical protein
MHLGASSTAFNAFSSSNTLKERTGVQKTMTTGRVMPMSNAFAGYALHHPALHFRMFKLVHLACTFLPVALNVSHVYVVLN